MAPVAIPLQALITAQQAVFESARVLIQIKEHHDLAMQCATCAGALGYYTKQCTEAIRLPVTVEQAVQS